VRQSANAQLAQLRTAAQKQTEDLQRATEAQIADLRAALEQAQHHAETEIEDARRVAQAQVDDVQRAMSRRIADVQQRLTDAESRLNGTRREMEQLVAAAAERDRNPVETRLLAAIRALDEARSLGVVLELLGRHAGQEAERAAVLLVKGAQLVVWSVTGFSDMANATGASLDLAAAGIAAEVVRSGAAVSRSGADTDQRVAGPPFALDTRGRDMSAVPVVVGGAVVAVVYADAPSREPQRWPAALEVLARHASTVLEALTVQQAVGLSLPHRVVRASHDAVAGPRHDRSVQ
jgi:hypothetical protein